jgi:hypothetical protein
MAKSFLVVVSATFIALIVLLGSTTYLVDPTGRMVLRHPDKLSLCAPGPRLGNLTGQQAGESGLLAFAASGKRTVLLGTSQVGIGLNGNDPALGPLAGKAYSLAVGGGSMTEIARLAESAMNHNKVDTIILGLSYSMFGAGQNASSTRAIALADSMTAWDDALMDAQAVFSPLAVRVAITTLMPPASRCSDEQQAANGQWTGWPRARQRQLERALAAGSLDNLNQESFAGWMRWIIRSHCIHAPCTLAYSTEGFLALRRMLETARQTKTHLIVFMTPNTPAVLEALYHAPAPRGVEAWKRELVSTLAEYGVLIRDFSVHHAAADDEFPLTAKNLSFDHEPAFYDATHFTPAVGHAILQSLFGRESVGDGGYGAALSLSNLEEHLAAARAARQRYRAAYPEDAAWIEQAMDRAGLTRVDTGGL